MGKWVHRMISYNLDSKSGVCTYCGPVKIKVKKKGATISCYNSEKRWLVGHGRAAVANKIGVSWQTLNRLVAESDGNCEICGTNCREKLCVDHCHANNTFRGLLCGNCNRGLGLFKENISSLRNAITYLKKETHPET